MQTLEWLETHLSRTMLGSVSVPGEASYEEAVSIWAKPNVLPRLVAHCANEADVQLAV